MKRVGTRLTQSNPIKVRKGSSIEIHERGREGTEDESDSRDKDPPNREGEEKCPRTEQDPFGSGNEDEDPSRF